ncbi:SGNH/GDSL hydrolase family protein [Saccharomonospora piscinae]|uniref:SGNH/GDSL hydrolase family protein n=1 Tax=Saccharomonospora piscinae TaxID=687388 RepID=UPI00110643CD|nr:SGNH/GDSL hydrolase family protein [Saccharomonospora piscinae]TLW92369.1 SGNH/GDSL hydrolase family protein [Saccharomonospora piscinae]
MRRTHRVLASATAALTATSIAAIPPATAQDMPTGWCADRADLTVLGPSSETGYGTTGYDSPDGTYSPTPHAWVAQFARAADATWNTTTDVHARNGAMIWDFLPGGRWPSTVAALDAIRDTQPDLVLVGGVFANEYLNNWDLAHAERNLRRLVTELRTARPGVDLVFTIYPDIDWPESRRPWADWAEVIQRVATDTGTRVIDLRPLIDTPYNDTEGHWSDDHAHLNDHGQTEVAQHVWNEFETWTRRC